MKLSAYGASWDESLCFYVKPIVEKGRTVNLDHWSGQVSDVLEDGSDGPLASIEAARDRITELKQQGLISQPVTVYVRGGTYYLSEPIRFKSCDSYPVTYVAYPGETPEFIGGRPVMDWEETEHKGSRAWISDVSGLIEKCGSFRSFFVNGERRDRSRWPKTGDLEIKSLPGITPDERASFYHGSTSCFDFHEGDIPEWISGKNAEVMARHIWVEERLPIQRIDRERSRFCFSRNSRFTLTSLDGNDPVKYWVENVGEALSTPGEWFLDEVAGTLTYLPYEGEKLEDTTCVIPLVSQFVRFEGDPLNNRAISFVQLKGLSFSCSDWMPPPAEGNRFDPYHQAGDSELPEAAYVIPGAGEVSPRKMPAGIAQAAANVPGAIHMESAVNCCVEDCTVHGVGFYAINLGYGCHGNQIVGNTLYDLGAGGVKLSGGDCKQVTELRNGGNIIADNHIYDAGNLFFSGTGVAVIHSANNRILHNHIHHLYHMGISCGWVWGESESVTRNNLIAFNHIHHLSRNQYMDDMGGIYMLGVQSNTFVCNNHIHDIESHLYGGWGIYLDEGSSHIVVEKNLVHDTQCAAFILHYGVENSLRNNIFINAGEGSVGFGSWQGWNAFTMQHNIIVSNGQPVFHDIHDDARFEIRPFRSDYNCCWDRNDGFLSGDLPMTGQMKRGRSNQLIPAQDLTAWRALGNDRHSIFSNPGITVHENGQVEVKKDSPVWELGFEPFSCESCGPRPADQRIFVLPHTARRYRIYLDC